MKRDQKTTLSRSCRVLPQVNPNDEQGNRPDYDQHEFFSFCGKGNARFQTANALKEQFCLNSWKLTAEIFPRVRLMAGTFSPSRHGRFSLVGRISWRAARAPGPLVHSRDAWTQSSPRHRRERIEMAHLDKLRLLRKTGVLGAPPNQRARGFSRSRPVHHATPLPQVAAAGIKRIKRAGGSLALESAVSRGLPSLTMRAAVRKCAARRSVQGRGHFLARHSLICRGAHTCFHAVTSPRLQRTPPR